MGVKKEENADTLRFSASLRSQQFTVGGIDYSLALALGDSTTGGFSTQTTFSVLEEQSATATVRGTIRAVPEPATLALMTLGIVGVRFTRRKAA